MRAPARAFVLDKHVDLEACLALVHSRTGLRSEVLIMGTLISWIMRPQPELREAVLLYGAAHGLDRRGGRHRSIAMHIRHGDKPSMYSRHMRNES